MRLRITSIREDGGIRGLDGTSARGAGQAGPPCTEVREAHQATATEGLRNAPPGATVEPPGVTRGPSKREPWREPA